MGQDGGTVVSGSRAFQCAAAGVARRGEVIATGLSKFGDAAVGARTGGSCEGNPIRITTSAEGAMPSQARLSILLLTPSPRTPTHPPERKNPAGAGFLVLRRTC